jgi:hypothetical protein
MLSTVVTEAGAVSLSQLNKPSPQVCVERRTVKSINPKLRADPAKAKSVITDIFKELPPTTMRSYLTFLHNSIRFLSSHYHDRWGISLFGDGIRLNVGRIGVLALRQDVLRVLVERKVAPSGTTFRKRTYETAPGCRKTSVPLTQLQTVLPTLSKAHHGAMSIAAKRKPVKGIREAHSPGVIEYLSEFVHKPVPVPTYQRNASLTKAMLQKRKRFLAQEGKLKKFTLSKRERDPSVRANALAEYGPLCKICGFDFAATYGAFAMTCVEVHHKIGLAGAGKRGVTTTLDDVLVVCPNCHRALHQYKNPNDWKAFQKACRLG